ncbi:MAG: carbohydrate ABC transporter substrate-binding protein [Clostridia bacterium]|nr:carbohydrate ABC transporter substrate-binding protein [Clostridia bacterium]
MKKLLALILAALMLLACTAALAEEAAYPEVVDGIDFGGATIYVYDYWTASDERKTDPTEEEQAQYDYRDWIMSTYNCEIHQIAKGDWGSNVTELTNFCSAPDGTLCLYILPPDFVGGPMGNDLLAKWNGRDLIDLSDEQWNAGDVDFMTKGGDVYGVATGHSEPRRCLYFNKRVLEEAGIDWNTIYDMQADGTWTWEAFETMLKQIQKDTDNDGVIDIYGMTGSNVDMYRVAVFGNGGSFFGFNDAGELEITAGSDNTLEALAWAKDIWNTYGYQQPADGSWDYYKEAWKQGFCGFYMYQTYGGFNDNSEMSDMADEWGCVAFPVGPKGDTYVHIISDNITVIPNVYDDDTVNKLAYIYKLWSAATPGYDDEDAWIGNKYNFTDDRAVDETYAMLREPEHCSSDICLYIGSVNDVEGQDFLWNLGGSTPAELLEAKTPVWQGLIDTFNGK